MMKIKILSSVVLASIFLISYQNCSPAFNVASPESFTLESIEPSILSGSNKQNPFSCVDPKQTSVKTVKRLTKEQYANTLLQLVGSTTFTAVEPKLSSLFSDELRKNVTDFSNSITESQMTGYQIIAESVYGYIQSRAPVAEALAGVCLKSAPVTNLCRDNFIKSFGLKAFRRPLTAAEVSKWATGAFALGESPTESVALVAYGMMLSPFFIMKTEFGDDASPASLTFRLNPYEVASRLSYELVDSPPDQALYEAAANNNLNTIQQLEPHVDRLLSSPQGKKKVKAFFTYWLDPRKYSASSFASEFLQGLDVAAVNAEFEREMDEYIEYIVFTKKGTFTELLNSRLSFARTPAVAEIYGHNAVTTDSGPAQTSSERQGLLMRGPVLATEGAETHPIVRGVKIRTRFLCETMALPSGVMTNDPTFFSDAARKISSTRTRTEGITASAACMGCHQRINPSGFAFENFDGLGRVRQFEKAFSVGGTFLAEHPVVTASNNVPVGGRNPASISDGKDLINQMLSKNDLPGCFIKQTRRFYKIQNESPEDACDMNKSYEQLMISESKNTLLDVFKSQIINESIFVRRME
jgi:hypothetical protein